MKLKPNPVRRKLDSGKVVVGTVFYSWSAAVMDQAGIAGIDLVRIDTEHAWRRDQATEDAVRVALAAGVSPFVRVDREDPYLIRKALEIGAEGIIVPDVHTPEEAEAVVKAAKFPPTGTRGYGSICLSGGWGTLGGADWVKWSDREPMIGVMIENVKAMEKVDQIMAVKGLDFVLFGPSDYSMSLGARTSLPMDDPRVDDAIKRTIKAARKASKHIMITAADGDAMRKYAALGATMLEVGNDLAACRAAWSASATTGAEINAKRNGKAKRKK